MLVDFHTHRETAWDEASFTPSSFGIHPWEADRFHYDTYDQFCRLNGEAFRLSDAIGECGVDRACDVDLDQQRHLFEYHLMLADSLPTPKPVVVHCVRAFDLLLQLRKQYTRAPWVVHGFRGGIEQALQLHRAEIGISFGDAILNPRNDKLRRCLQEYPYPFMLETDTSCTPIADVYAEAAHIKSLTFDALRQQVEAYLFQLFPHIQIAQ